MVRIAAAGNTEPPIYHLILKKGFLIEIRDEYLVAIKDDMEFVADTMVELAGLILLIENKGENWKVDDIEIDNYMSFVNKK